MIPKTGPLPLVLAPILGLFTIPFLTLALLFNELVRLLIAQILWILHGNKVELVSDGADSFWGYKKEGSSRNVISYVVIPVGSLDSDKIVNFYRENIQSHRDNNGYRPYKKFEKIMTQHFGYFCWKKPSNFNVDEHIRTLNEEQVFKIHDLQEMLTEFSKDFDETRPQWEIVLVPRFDDGSGQEKSLLCSRFLHSYMDGLSFMMLFKEQITPEIQYTIDPLKFIIPFWKKTLFYLNTAIYGPFFWFVINLERFYNKTWIIKNQTKTRQKFYTLAKSQIQFETMRKIRSHSNIHASVTNVISIAFVASARKILPPERLVDEILISELVAYLPYPNSYPQNRFALFTYPIDVQERDVWKKLKTCKKESLKSMFGPELLSTFYFFKLAGRFPSFLFPIWLSGSSSSVLMSNAPFSKSKVCFRDGTPILEMAGFTPQPNDIGLTITISRYGDEIKIFGCSDSSWLSQSELTSIIDQIPVEIEAMSKSIEVEEDSTFPLVSRLWRRINKSQNQPMIQEEEEEEEFDDEGYDDDGLVMMDLNKRISISESVQGDEDGCGVRMR